MTECVYLKGAPFDRGGLTGRYQRDVFRAAMEEFRRRLEEAEVSPTELPDRAREFTMRVNALVPEWLVEARAAAATAQASVATYLGMNAARQLSNDKRPNPTWDHGLAVVATGKACASDKAILHHNRDSWRNPQCAIARADSPGTLAYVGVQSAGSLGVTAFVNEKGLAGCWQSGPPTKETGCGLRPSLMLRALAERSLNCRQALEYFSELQTRFGLYTSGDHGVIFLLADSTGEMVQIESGALRHAAGFQKQGLVTVANQFQLPDSPDGSKARDVSRQRKIREHLLSQPIDAFRAVQGSRLEGEGEKLGVCNDSTVAGFTAVLGSKGQPGYALVSIGSPRYTLPIPVFPEHGVPVPLFDGSVWDSSEALRQDGPEGGLKPGLLDEMTARIADLMKPASTQPLDAASREKIINESYMLFPDFMDQAFCPE